MHQRNYINFKKDAILQIFFQCITTSQIGSNIIADIRINNKQIDKIHLILKLTDEFIMVMDNQSEKGTYLLQNHGRINLTALTTYEYDVKEKLLLQIGDYKLEYQYLHEGPNQVPESDHSEEVSDLSADKVDHNLLTDATQIIPQKPIQKPKRPPVVEEDNKNDPFSFGDATQIIGNGGMNGFKAPGKMTPQKKEVGFLMPQAPKRGGDRKLPQVQENALDAPTQLIDHNSFVKKQEAQANNNNINLFAETQLINVGGFGNNKQPENNLNNQVDDILSDATQLLSDFYKPPPNDNKVKNAPFDLYGTTQVIGEDPFKKANGVKQQAKPVNFLDPTQIIPVNKKKEQPMGFEPTLLIADKNKPQPRQYQNEKSDIDRLLDSDDDSPRFGAKAQPKIVKNDSKKDVSSSVEDIFDVLDGGQKDDKKKQGLMQIEEHKQSDEEDEDEGPKRPAQKFKQFIVQDKAKDDDLSDLVEEKLEEPKLEQQNSQRYNKKRKANEISNNEPQLANSQSAKKRKLNEDLQSQKSVKGAKFKTVDPVLENDEEEEKLGPKPSIAKNLTVLVSGKAKSKDVIDNIKKLGGKVIDDIEHKFDVMVTDGKLIRNCKLLQSINIGAKIVSVEWVKDSIKSKEFLEITDKYLIIDKDFEKQQSCKIMKLYEAKNKDQLLKDYTVYISGNLQGISQEQMSLLVTSAGGEVVKSEKDKKKANLYILDVEKDKKMIDQFKKNKKDAPSVVSMQLVFEGILKQELDFKKHSLI